MAKRAPSGELAYNPLDMVLAQSVVKGVVRPQDLKTTAMQREGEDAAVSVVPGLQSAIGNQAVGSSGPNSHSISQKSTSRTLNREKRVLLTQEEERQVERLVDRIGEELGASLKLSHFLRACMSVLCHAELELVRHAAEFRPLSRPANGDAVALAQFEQTLAKLLSKALRDAPALR